MKPYVNMHVVCFYRQDKVTGNCPVFKLTVYRTE